LHPVKALLHVVAVMDEVKHMAAAGVDSYGVFVSANHVQVE
jgi:hypothetical protein